MGYRKRSKALGLALLFVVVSATAFGWGAREQESITGTVIRIDASAEDGDTVFIRLSTPEGEVIVEIAPSDVLRLGLADGDEITVSGNWYFPDSVDATDDRPEISARIVTSNGRRFRLESEEATDGDRDDDDSDDDWDDDADPEYDDGPDEWADDSDYDDDTDYDDYDDSEDWDDEDSWESESDDDEDDDLDDESDD